MGVLCRLDVPNLIAIIIMLIIHGASGHEDEDNNNTLVGEVVPIDDLKKGLPYLRELEQMATSITELTCLKAFKEGMGNPTEAFIKTGDDGNVFNWCEALDETPIITQNNTHFVLIRMKLYYTKHFVKSKTLDRDVHFYIIASRTLGDNTGAMNIVAIFPRISCIADHKEAVVNIELFVKFEYFMNGDVPGCHDKFHNLYSYHTYVDRITFTGGYSNHLFLYGARLIQSTDAGHTFVTLKSFPKDKYVDLNNNEILDTQHQIVLMAFDSEGHYAFLTNREELWIGSTGDVRQIRLRPSQGYSMMQTMTADIDSTTSTLSAIEGSDELYVDAFPFGLMYDRSNVLIEMVIVANATNENQIAMTRRIPVDLIFRFEKLTNELNDKTTSLVDDAVVPYDYSYEVPFKWSTYCPMRSVKFFENYKEDAQMNQITDFKSRPDSNSGNADNDHPAKWAINLAITNMWWEKIKEQDGSGASETSSFNPDKFDRWLLETQEFASIGPLRFISGEKLSSKSEGNRLLQHYYLDYGTPLRLELYYVIKSDAVVGERDFEKHRISLVQLNVDNPNGTLLQVDTEKVRISSLATVRFIVDISVIKSPLLQQNLPGENLIPFNLIFHMIGGFGTCAKRLSEPFTSDSQSTVVHIGCRPSTSIIFNWNLTLYSIQFKNLDAHYGRDSECYNNEFVCFFARAPLVLHFDIYDITKQTYVPYTGNYIMRVIAGGYEKDKMENYTEQQQQGYNIPGTSDVSLIWNEWDLKASQKIDRPPPHFESDIDAEDKKKTSRERVLKAGDSAIQWACHTLSPCDRVVPNADLQTVFWFRIFITNRDVESNTLCLYEKEFDIMLYGFPPSPETQLFTTIIFCLCMLGILYLMFICLRGHKRVWRSAKLKMSGWYLIIRDTFPKELKTTEEQGQDELLTQLQKDNIILSLQGHLKIPPLVARDSAFPAGKFAPDARESLQSRTSSLNSVQSDMSITSMRTEIIEKAPPPPAPSNWTDLVYEQIISKRLAAIVDKNRKMRANILRRTSLHDITQEQEKRYEQEHKRTIAEETVFAGKKER